MHIKTCNRWEETMKGLTACKHPAPKLLALKVLTSSCVWRMGGRKRKSPRGGLAKGIPVEELEPRTTHKKMVNIIPPKKSSLYPVISSPTSEVFPIWTWGAA